jgi:CRISPR-associated protein Cmx8
VAVRKNKNAGAIPKRSTAATIHLLEYSLAELSTSQHRAGLAGLVLMVNWLTEQRRVKGICGITRLDDQGVTFEIDKAGLISLFGETYASIQLEKRPKASDKSTAEKPSESKPEYRPKGAFLVDLDQSDDEIWISLWREFAWFAIRKKDPSRTIYRDNKKAELEATKIWKALISPKQGSTDLSGTDFVGARAFNAERVAFRDSEKQKLLLNFWPYAAQVYLPVRTVIDNKTRLSKSEEVGYALAIPEVARLDTFCKILPTVLRNNRSDTKWRFRPWRPRDAVIDIPAEGALDFFSKLRDQISQYEGSKGISRVVTSIEVVHLDPKGQDLSIRGAARVEPESYNPDEYERVRRNLWNHQFRKQRVVNILGECEWYRDFDKLLARLPMKLGFDSEYFSRDAKESFKNEVTDLEDRKMSEESDSPFGTPDAKTGEDVIAPKSTAALVYQTVGRYLDRKLIAKRKFGYSDVMSGLADKDEYSKERRALAIDAFHSVKNRSGEDFIEYFANTLCSVSQSMSEADYVSLAKALHDDADDVRTLTLLALSARS